MSIKKELKEYNKYIPKLIDFIFFLGFHQYN